MWSLEVYFDYITIIIVKIFVRTIRAGNPLNEFAVFWRSFNTALVAC